MGRPRSVCNIDCCIQYDSFQPVYNGERFSRAFVEVTAEEIESLRLKNIKDLDQMGAAKHMGVSQSTFQRILTSAYKKVSEALIEGKELRIKK